MILPAADPFEIPALGLRFVDFQSAPPADVWQAREILWGLLQRDVIDALRPGLSLCTAGTEVEQGCDPALGVVNYVVYSGGRVHGAFNLYNIRRDGGTAVATPAPAVRAVPGHTLGETWGLVMRHILEHVSDRWEFPEAEELRWVRDPIAIECIAELERGGHTVTRRPDGSPARADRGAS